MTGTGWSSSLRLRANGDDVERLLRRIDERLTAGGWGVRELGAGASEALRAGESVHYAVTRADSFSVSRSDSFDLRAVAFADPSACDALDSVFLRCPFTDTELAAIRSDLPLTSAAADRMGHWVPGAGDAPLAGLSAIFTIHHQTDFVVLLEQALALGDWCEAARSTDPLTKDGRLRGLTGVESGRPLSTWGLLARPVAWWQLRR